MSNEEAVCYWCCASSIIKQKNTKTEHYHASWTGKRGKGRGWSSWCSWWAFLFKELLRYISLLFVLSDGIATYICTDWSATWNRAARLQGQRALFQTRSQRRILLRLCNIIFFHHFPPNGGVHEHLCFLLRELQKKKKKKVWQFLFYRYNRGYYSLISC